MNAGSTGLHTTMVGSRDSLARLMASTSVIRQDTAFMLRGCVGLDHANSDGGDAVSMLTLMFESLTRHSSAHSPSQFVAGYAT